MAYDYDTDTAIFWQVYQMLYNNNISLFGCSIFEFHTIADLVMNWVFRVDNQSVGARHLMIHQVLADEFDLINRALL